MTVNSTNVAYAGLAATLTGNGLDFSMTLSPTSGSAIAGTPASTALTLTPLAGFAAPITISCADNASGSVCTPAVVSTILSAATNVPVSMTTTSQYTVVGYGGLGSRGILSLVAILSGVLLWRRRSRSTLLHWSGLAGFILLAATFFVTGCSGKLPARNAVYTLPGSYTYTLTATDGIISHSVSYTLKVTAQ